MGHRRPAAMGRPSVDILVLSLGTTRGLRIADAQLAELLAEADPSVSVAVAGVRIGLAGRLRRGYPVNDLVEAIAARRALGTALRRHAPRAVIISTTTAALLAGRPPVPYAVWLDSPARLNRPGRRNAVLHVLERRRLAQARRVLVLSPQGAAALPPGAAPAVIAAPPLAALPPPPRGAPAQDAEPLVVAYTPDPKAKGLALVCRTLGADPSAGGAAGGDGDSRGPSPGVPGAARRPGAGGDGADRDARGR